jgi:putative NADPH-quinone reductase
MKVLLIIAHPNPRSFNHTLATRIQTRFLADGVEVMWGDLYQEGFDPVLPGEEVLRKGSFDSKVLRYVQELRESSGLVILHPDWWGLPPAILKGWVDRVLLPGVGYAYEEGSAPLPLLTHLRGVVVVTRDNPGSGLSEAFWLQEVFPLCGIRPAGFRVVEGLKLRNPYEVEREVVDLIEELYTFIVSN